MPRGTRRLVDGGLLRIDREVRCSEFGATFTCRCQDKCATKNYFCIEKGVAGVLLTGTSTVGLAFKKTGDSSSDNELQQVTNYQYEKGTISVAMSHFFVASLNFLHQDGFEDGLNQFLADRSLIWGWISGRWQDFTLWLSQPNVLSIVLAWWITFTLIITVLLMMGFGPAGVLSGSVAAAFQSWMYGGFTPAAGIFATLTSVGMLGYAAPIFAAVAMLIATIVAVVVWLFLSR